MWAESGRRPARLQSPPTGGLPPSRGLRRPRWPEDGAAQHGLPTLRPKLAASQRGQKPAGRTPLGSYSLIKRRRAWTPREGAVLRLRGVSPEAGLWAQKHRLGHWADSCERAWSMARLVVTGHVEVGWYFKGGLVPSLSRGPQTSFFPFHLSLFFLSAHP